VVLLVTLVVVASGFHGSSFQAEMTLLRRDMYVDFLLYTNP
jgi:hypothetical protein